MPADPLDGTLVLLPAEAQRRLVQLVYFLPCLPARLLACLSRCCIMGRISSDLAATLIGILHMRYNAERASYFTVTTQGGRKKSERLLVKPELCYWFAQKNPCSTQEER